MEDLRLLRELQGKEKNYLLIDICTLGGDFSMDALIIILIHAWKKEGAQIISAKIVLNAVKLLMSNVPLEEMLTCLFL